jgi:O-antigen biosynthesis protein
MRAVVRRARPADGTTPDRWGQYLRGVEPAVAAVPRLHRFAVPPVTADTAIAASPVAVWIEGGGGPAVRTRQSLADSTISPVSALDGPISDALASTRCEYVVLLRAGDSLAPLALERLGQAAALAPDVALITCDDDQLDAATRRHSPRFRPGPSPDRWLACDDSGPLLMVARERAAALIKDEADGRAWRHQLALALAGEDGMQHAHVPLLLCHRGHDVPDAPALDPAAVSRLIARSQPSARIEQAGLVRRVRRAYADEALVEVIVCLRDRSELLKRCAGSVLSETEYERFTLTLVDNGSREPKTLDLLWELARDPRVRVLQDERPFNFAALNNAAARSSSADVLVFLNNDTEVVDPGWLTTLLEEALRPQVGAVAPLLLYPDRTVQHAGAAIGLHGYAGHPFAGLAPDAQTPFGRADGGTRNWLAVSAACMMVGRHKFNEVGGFDESFVIAGNDVDLCLRLTASGFRSVCVPHTMLVHDESRSRGEHIDPGDFARSERSYGDFRTVGDPFYNPNLTLRGTDCAPRVPGEEF